jgi:hypothetical protein
LADCRIGYIYNMPPETLVAIYFRFPYISKADIRKFFKSEEIDLVGGYTTLIPIKGESDIYGFGFITDLSVIDKIEADLLGVEIDIYEIADVYKKIGVEYMPFYPAVDAPYLD